LAQQSQYLDDQHLHILGIATLQGRLFDAPARPT